MPQTDFSSTYILDTNIIRSLFGFYYPKDLFPEIWAGFHHLDALGLITSVECVKKECYDQLPMFPSGKPWLQTHAHIFTQPTEKEWEMLKNIVSYPEFQLTPGEIQQTKTMADLQLVAKGACTGGIVVTDEKYEPVGRKIPTMCERFGVQCISRIELLRIVREIGLGLR